MGSFRRTSRRRFRRTWGREACAPAPPNRTIDMSALLVVDVGNTTLVVGAYDKDRLIRTWRLVTVHDRTEDELAVMLDGLLAQEDLALDAIDALVLGSVVPPLTQSFTRLAERYLDRAAFLRGAGSKTAGPPAGAN